MQKSKYSWLVATILFLHLITTASDVQSEVYKWTDENGKTHYSDKPIDAKSQKLRMNRQPSSEEVNQAKDRARLVIGHQRKVQEIANDEAEDRKQAEDKLDAEEKKRVAFCAQATREIRLLGRGRVTYQQNADGSRKYLSDKDKNESIDKYKAEMKKRCN